MNKYSKIIRLIFLLLVIFCFFAFVVNKEPSDTFGFSDWGNYLSQLYNNEKTLPDTSDTVYIGNYGTIEKSDITMAEQFFITNGLSKSEAELKALIYVKEREALYQAAIKNGYGVTDDEVKSYLNELKKKLENADNKEDVVAIINQFESEEAYWDFEFTVYKKNLPIQNYVSVIEEDYFQTNATASNEDWLNYFQQFKTQLVEEENFIEVKE